jgi:hypothetical protein
MALERAKKTASGSGRAWTIIDLYVADFAVACSQCAARAIADRRIAQEPAVRRGAAGSFAPLGYAIVVARKVERIIAITSARTAPAAAGA